MFFFNNKFIQNYSEGGSTLLAPNGKPSNLTPEQYKLVRTPEFKAWFGDWENDPSNASKVVDKNGEPKLMWHGSNAMSEINIFKSNKGHDYSFFSEDKNESSRYVIDFDQTEVAKKIDKRNYTEWTIKRDLYYKSKIKPFFIKSIKIFDYNNLSETDKKYTHEFLNKNKNELCAVIKEFASNMGMSFNVYLEENDIDVNITESELLKYFLSSSSDDWWILETKVFQEYIKYNNFDSFVTKESGAWNIAVYNPKQIKLADGTNTTFDSSNPDIRFEQGGKILGINDDELKGVVLYNEEKGNYLVPKDTFYIWIYDDENAVEKINSGDYDYVFFPIMGIGKMGSQNYISPILAVWDETFSIEHKGSDKLLAIAHGWIGDDKDKMYIEMMTVRNDKRRQGLNSKMIRILRNYYKIPKENVIFNQPTEEGKLFAQSGKYLNGGEIKTNMKLSLLNEVKNNVSVQYIAACAEMCGHTNVTGKEAQKIRNQMIEIIEEYGDTEYNETSLKKLCKDATMNVLGKNNIQYTYAPKMYKAAYGGGIPIFDYKYDIGTILTDDDERHASRSKDFKNKRTYYVVVKQTTDWRLDKTRTSRIHYPAYWIDAHLGSPFGNSLGSYRVDENEVVEYTPTNDEINELIKSYERRVEISKSIGMLSGGLDEVNSTLIAIKAKYKPELLSNKKFQYKDANIYGKHATQMVRAAAENEMDNYVERVGDNDLLITFPSDAKKVVELYNIVDYVLGVSNIKPVE